MPLPNEKVSKILTTSGKKSQTLKSQQVLFLFLMKYTQRVCYQVTTETREASFTRRNRQND